MSNYKKPNILFQPMTLNANITSGCSNHFAHSDAQSCAIEIPGEDLTIFSLANVCDIHDPNDIDDICYHVPTSSGMSVFMS